MLLAGEDWFCGAVQLSGGAGKQAVGTAHTNSIFSCENELLRHLSAYRHSKRYVRTVTSAQPTRTPTFVFLTLEFEEISPHETLQDVRVVRLRRLDVKMMTDVVTSRLQQETEL